MDNKIVIAVLVGTVREGRESLAAARFVAELGREQEDVEIVFVDPAELTFPLDGDDDSARDPRYTEITARADAFFIVTPEYNHGYPGSLKRMLDSEYHNYLRKPVAVAGVSSGPWGGARVCEALLPVLHRIGLVRTVAEVYFPKVQDLFDEQGAMKAEHLSAYTKTVKHAYHELLWFARVLKQARDQATTTHV